MIFVHGAVALCSQSGGSFLAAKPRERGDAALKNRLGTLLPRHQEMPPLLGAAVSQGSCTPALSAVLAHG